MLPENYLLVIIVFAYYPFDHAGKRLFMIKALVYAF